MYSLNRAQVIGHLTQAPEVRQTPNGQAVGDLNIVTRSVFTDASGKTIQTTAYYSVVVWRGLADIASRFLKKGSQVYISGRLQTDEWEDDKGQKRSKTRLTADDMIMLDPKMPQAPVAAGSAVGGGLNQVEVLGNATRDPELRQTPNGEKVCNFGVATNFVWKDRSGQDQEKTEFHNVVVWGPLAESVSQAIRKGRKVYVSGRLQTRSWETPDGQKRYSTEIVAEKALALGTQDAELGSPDAMASSTNVSFSAPNVAQEPAGTPAGVDIPEIKYESDIKPEDLPF